MQANDILITAGIQLAYNYRKRGFYDTCMVLVYDDRACNTVVCCFYKGKHYHIPCSCPEGVSPSEAAKRLRDDDQDWLDNFMDTMLEKLLDASPHEQAFMEILDEPVKAH